MVEVDWEGVVMKYWITYILDVISGATLGFMLGTLLTIVIISMAKSPRSLRREAVLPLHCIAGEQVVLTTPTPIEFYTCEGEPHWVKR